MTMLKPPPTRLSPLPRAGLGLAVLFACSAPPNAADRLRALGYPEETLTSWSHYLGDPGRTHYSSLAQIDTSNVDRLEVAWTYASGGLAEGVRTEIQHSPLIVDSALYGTNASVELFKVDARTGEEIWRVQSLSLIHI